MESETFLETWLQMSMSKPVRPSMQMVGRVLKRSKARESRSQEVLRHLRMLRAWQSQETTDSPGFTHGLRDLTKVLSRSICSLRSRAATQQSRPAQRIPAEAGILIPPHIHAAKVIRKAGVFPIVREAPGCGGFSEIVLRSGARFHCYDRPKFQLS